MQRTYTIPLRKSFSVVTPRRRTPRALRTVRDFVKRHCKVETVKIGKQLNEAVWARGLTNPPHKVKVTVVVEDKVAKVELEGFAYVEAVKAAPKKEESAIEKLASKVGVKAPEAAAPVSEMPAEQQAKPVAAKKAAPAKKKVADA